MGYYKNSFNSGKAFISESKEKEHLKAWLFLSPLALGSTFILIYIFLFKEQNILNYPDNLNILPIVFSTFATFLLLISPLIERLMLLRVLIAFILSIDIIILLCTPFIIDRSYLENSLTCILIIIYIGGALWFLWQLNQSLSGKTQ